MTEQDFSKWKQLLLKATVLLNTKKNLDLSFSNAEPYYYDSVKSIEGLKADIMSRTFDRPGHTVEELLSWSYFDPQARMAHIDDYADYGKLSGDDKVVARLAFWLYCLCLGEGWFATGRDRLMKKTPLEWRNEHGIS